MIWNKRKISKDLLDSTFEFLKDNSAIIHDLRTAILHPEQKNAVDRIPDLIHAIEDALKDKLPGNWSSIRSCLVWHFIEVIEFMERYK